MRRDPPALEGPAVPDVGVPQRWVMLHRQPTVIEDTYADDRILAKVFFGMLARYVEDARIDVVEVSRLHRLHELLSRLGWAPGQSVADRQQ